MTDLEFILVLNFPEVFKTVPYTDIFSPEYGSGKTTYMMTSQIVILFYSLVEEWWKPFLSN